MKRKTFVLFALASVFMAACGYSATNALLYSDDFEGYTNGTPLIDGTNDWYSSSWTDTNNFVFFSAVLSNINLAAEGSTNAAAIPFDVTLSNRFQAQTSTNVWLHMRSRLLLYDGPTNMGYDTNATVMFYFNSNGYCVVCNGSNGWTTVTNTLAGLPATPVDTNSFTTLDVCLDYASKTWKINVNTVELTNNIGFINTDPVNYTGLDVYNSGLNTTSYVDDVSVYDATYLPVLSVSPSLLTNIANVTNQTLADQFFDVISSGDAPMDYHVVTNSITPGWNLALLGNGSGVLTNNATNRVVVRYDTASLPPGVYSNSFNVISTNWGLQTQTVQIVVDIYSMSLAPTSLSNTVLRGFNATSQTFGVSASGGNMSFSASADDGGRGWLHVSPTSEFSSGGATNILTNTYTTASLTNGDYRGTVTVASADGHGATGVVDIAMHVLATPILMVSPANIRQVIDKGANPTEECFQVWNASGTPIIGMDYQVSVEDDAGGIIQGVLPSSGTSTGQHDAIGISFNNNIYGFNSGAYTAIVAVVATNSGTGYAGQWGASSNIEVVLVISAPNSPSQVTATKGDYTDRVAVSWRQTNSPTGGSVTYNVRRHTTFDPNYARNIVSGLTVTNYDDTTASPGIRYFYWVQSVNSYAIVGTNSMYDSGYRGLSAPSGIFASDGAYTNKVAVSWASVDGAATYYVYRYYGGSAENVYYTTDTEYDDMSAVEGREYIYYVEATNSICGSLPSAGETGYVLSRPVVLSASAGLYAGKIRLAWNAVHGATAYEVWRSTQTITPPYGGGAKITDLTGTIYDDTGVTAGSKYYYWLKSKNATALSAFSGRAEGYAASASVDLLPWGLIVLPRRIGAGASPDVVSFRLADNGGAALTGDNGMMRLSFYSSTNAVFGDADDREIGTVDQHLELAIGSAGIFRVGGNNIALPNEEGFYYLYMRLAPVWPSLLAPTSEGGWVTQRSGAIEVSSSGSINYQAFNDYDGDGIADMAVHGAGLWDGRTIDGNEFARDYPFGGPGLAVPGDYDGDGKADPVVYDESRGYWQGLLSARGYAYVDGPFGGPGSRAVPGDYNGDGKAEVAVYDTANSLWYAFNVGSGWVMGGLQFGSIGYEPVIGDYDGDGVWDLALYNESNGLWYVRTVSGTPLVLGEQWGGPGFLAVPGDYDGDGFWDYALYDQATGRWYIVSNKNRELIVNGTLWGADGYRPVSGDFNGDGLSDMAVYNSTSGKWFIRTVSGTRLAFDVPWGGAGRAAIGEVE